MMSYVRPCFWNILTMDLFYSLVHRCNLYISCIQLLLKIRRMIGNEVRCLLLPLLLCLGFLCPKNRCGLYRCLCILLLFILSPFLISCGSCSLSLLCWFARVFQLIFLWKMCEGIFCGIRCFIPEWRSGQRSRRVPVSSWSNIKLILLGFSAWEHAWLSGIWLSAKLTHFSGSSDSPHREIAWKGLGWLRWLR